MACAGSSALELLLGPEGEYVREIIIDELAKGIDAGWRSSVDSLVGSTRHRLLNLFGVSHCHPLCLLYCQVCVCALLKYVPFKSGTFKATEIF